MKRLIVNGVASLVILLGALAFNSPSTSAAEAGSGCCYSVCVQTCVDSCTDPQACWPACHSICSQDCEAC